MKKILCAFTLLLGTTQTFHAHADDYLLIRAAVAGADGFNQDYAAGIGFGHTLYHLIPHFAVEGEFLKSFSKMKSSAAHRTFAMTSVNGVFTYPMDQRLSLKGKFGLRYASIKDDTGTDTQNSNDTGTVYGIGVLYALDRTRELATEYVTSDANNFYQLIVGLQLHF